MAKELRLRAGERLAATLERHAEALRLQSRQRKCFSHYVVTTSFSITQEASDDLLSSNYHHKSLGFNANVVTKTRFPKYLALMAAHPAANENRTH